MIWSDILPLETRAEARAAIARCVASLRTTAQAAELIGAGRAYELSPGGARWHDLLTDEQLAPWRARIGERMFLRWEAATRQRLIQDALTLARDHLEQSAREAGVRLGRSARDTLADALRSET